MTTLVFILVIMAAFTHAGWNFCSKKIKGNLTVYWLGSMSINIVLFPVTAVLIFREGINPEGFIPIFISCFFHAFYYLTLFDSYKFGDISTAYPISRGTGVGAAAFVSIVFLHEQVSGYGLAGILTIVSGILIMGFSSGFSKKNLECYIYAILTGLAVAGYSLADSRSSYYNHPIVVLNLMSTISLLMVTPFAFRKGFRAAIAENLEHLKYGPIIGLGSLGTYLIILFAFSLSDQASYIVALREFSVVIASVLGFVFLKEKISFYKISGILLITAGLFLIKAV